jgi:hypothetical protein
MKTIQDFVNELNQKFPKVEAYQESFIFTEGKRFYKICRSRDGIRPGSSYGFVDKATGDLYKAASWNAPANYVRGNINDPSGLDACEQYSVKYLK